MKKERKYILVIAALLIISSIVVFVCAKDVPGKATAKGSAMTIAYLAKRWFYYWVASSYATRGLDALSANLGDFILMNPSPQDPIVLDLIRFFVSLLQPFYVLAISITGFYLILVSSTPSGRNKAKSMLVKLFISLALISLAPQIMTITLYMTENITSSVLGQADIAYYTYTLNKVIEGLKKLHMWSCLINVELGYYAFLPLFFLVWGTYLMLILRYLAVLLWIILLPLSIFLYSFDFTKNIGRNMLEQTILWSSLQIFNAVVVAVAAIAMISKEPGFMYIQFSVAGFLWNFGFDLILLVGVFSLVLTPALMLIWFRNFLP
ncbi:MAG: hypothetical protein U9M95_03470 [Candidatus Altiarchaeota archaeon]|nr:hypothetical protein [Candidatus Altiarchaeota archaeon]